MNKSLSEIKPMDKNSHLEEYIENRADIEAKDNYGNTPLISASAYGHVEVVKFLIESGADIEAKNNYGNTSLNRASANGCVEVVKILIESGADIEAKDNDGNTPLIRASANGHVDAVKIFIENGADIEAKNNDGYDFTCYLTKASKDEINKFIETGCFNFTVKPAKK